jgi:hypothetical protein
MPSKEFDVQLDEHGLEWLRIRFTTVGGQVVIFAVQYETTIREVRMPVVRYDNAHGFAHRDLLDRRGAVIDKRRLPESLRPALALAVREQDIRTNWRRYRENF